MRRLLLLAVLLAGCQTHRNPTEVARQQTIQNLTCEANGIADCPVLR